jgi:hypothetical protein
MLKFVVLVITLSVVAVQAQDKTARITIAGIQVEGTHLPADSVVRLLGLKVGQTVDDDQLLAACDKVSRTGLVADIDYSFRPMPDHSGSVVIFKLWDEMPLLPASVFPKENETAVWSCLQGADPIFARQLPNTTNALKFYVANLDRCITQTSERPLHAEAKVRCDENLKPAAIEFRIEPGTAAETGLPERGTVK